MRLLKLLVLLLAMSPMYSTAQTAFPFPNEPGAFSLQADLDQGDFVPGVLVFKVKDAYRTYCSSSGLHLPGFEKYMDALQAHGFQPLFPFSPRPTEVMDDLGQKQADLSLIFEMRYDANIDIETAVNFLSNSQLFEYVEPLYIYQPLYDPADPDTSFQYYLGLLQAREAWNLNRGDSNVVIGIIDTGTSFSHPELINQHHHNLNDPIDGLDNDNDGYIDNYRGWDLGGDNWYSPGDNDPSWGGTGPAIDHGVIVSGVAVAECDNNINIAGVGFNCSVMQVKVSVDYSPQIYRGYQGIVYAADHGASIINLAWGGTARSQMGQDAINYAAINRKSLIVASAGNTPDDLAFIPASYLHVLSVAGSEMNDNFWNTSASFGTTYNYAVDLCAPARDILTTTTNIGTYSATGTSLSAPIVCGVAGLVKSHFPNYNNAQVGERVRVSADSYIYGINPGLYTEKMGRGRVNAFEALTQVTPSIRVLDYEIVDPNDGLVQVGDTVQLQIRFINYLDSASNVSVNMSTPNSVQFGVVHGSVDLGDMGTLDTVSIRLAPFLLRIKPSAAAGFRGYVRLGYSANGYTDWEYLEVDVEPDYINLDINRFETSMNGTGRWGYMNYPNLAPGKGLTIDAVAGMMNDAGFLLGTSSTQVSDNFENQNGSSNNHFVNLNPISRSLGGPIADLTASTSYNDNGAGGNALGVTVQQNSYQYALNPDDNYFIQEYQISNNSPTDTLKNVFAGMYFDLDGYWRTNNVSRYDTAARCIYNYTEEWVTLWNMGISLLTPDSLHGYAVNVDSFDYSMADKWTALSSPPQNAELANVNLVQFTSAGPFEIAPGQSHTVAFAVVEGDSVPHLRETVQRAYDKYWCVIRGGISQSLDLGADLLHCNGDTTFILDAGTGFSSYLWEDGSTGQTHSVDSSGNYWVRVTDANGCEDYDQIQVSIGDGLQGGFTCNPALIFVGDTVVFQDSSQTATEWGWDFGDGSIVCPIFSNTSHTFTNPGSYNVNLYISNGTCRDTISKVIQVDTLTSTQNPFPNTELSIYPNPNQGQFQYELLWDESGEYKLELINSLGQTVFQVERENQTRNTKGKIQVKHLPTGVYSLQIYNSRKRIVKSILIY